MRMWPVLALVGALNFASPGALLACSCGNGESPSETIASKPFIFSGEVLWRSMEMESDGEWRFVHLVAVHEIWKGDVREMELMYSSLWGCGMVLEPGTEHLFMVYKRWDGVQDEGEFPEVGRGFWFTGCGGANRLEAEYTASYLAALGEPRVRLPSPHGLSESQLSGARLNADAQFVAIDEWMRRGREDLWGSDLSLNESIYVEGRDTALRRTLPWVVVAFILGWVVRGNRNLARSAAAGEADEE